MKRLYLFVFEALIIALISCLFARWDYARLQSAELQQQRQQQAELMEGK